MTTTQSVPPKSSESSESSDSSPPSRLSRLLTACRPRLPRTVRGRRRLVQAAMVVCVLGLLPQAWIHVSTSDRVSEIEDAPAAPVAIVFGAGLRPDGEPTQWLSHRLDTAAELYQSGRVRALLVSGDNSGPSYNEPGAMREYLIDEGVPARRIVTDDAGFNTWDSCARARSVFGVTEALLVSQDFHIPRVVALCEAAGIDGWGVSVPEWRSLFSSFREIAAAGTAAWQVISTPPPSSTSPPSASLERAMSGS